MTYCSLYCIQWTISHIYIFVSVVLYKYNTNINTVHLPFELDLQTCSLKSLKRSSLFCSILFYTSWPLNQKGDPAGVLRYLHSPPPWSCADPQGDVYCYNCNWSSQRIWELHPPEQVDWGKASPQMLTIQSWKITLLSNDTVFLCLEVCRGDSCLCRLWLQSSGGHWAAKSQRDRTERPHAGDNTTQVRASSTISSRWLNSNFLSFKVSSTSFSFY